MAFEDLLSGRISGAALTGAARALRKPAVARLGARILRRDLQIDALYELLDGSEFVEPDVAPRQGRAPRTLGDVVSSPEAPPWATTSASLTAQYAKGMSPETVLDRVVSEAERLARHKPWLRCLWTRDDQGSRQAAQASAARYRENKPCGPLDGVPVLIKEQIAVAGLPRRLGGDLPGPSPMLVDATLVARLRAAGAVIVGQTAMTELGLSPIGINPKRPPLRNPHHFERTAGGSSTGSGVAVAVGLVPCAIGADGGGSIRIPAAMCGVYGLKPSYGRVSRAGDGFSGSVNHDGPIAASTLDLALFLDAMHGHDRADPASLHAPAPSMPFAEAVRRSVRGRSIGVDEHEWRDADPAIVKACEQALKSLVGQGVELVDVTLKTAKHATAIGSLTLACEAYACVAHDLERHMDAYGADVQAFMHIASVLGSREYLWAQALRERLRREVAAAMAEVDLLALPTTAKTALPVSEADERTGRLDAQGVRAMCRYTFLGNLTGLPAGTAPVGLDPEGLPIGLQLVGDAWDEATVLACMAELERCGAARAPRAPHRATLSAEG